MSFRLTFGSFAGAAVSAALVVSAPVPAAAQDAADLASAVTALRAISTMRADFVQADANGQRVKGVLTLKRPGRIRFQYEKGVPMLIVSDGSALTFVDYEVRQVQRWPIKSSPLGALLDPSRDVGKYGRVMPTGSDRIVSIEVRDKARPEYGVITLIFTRKGDAPGGLELSSWAALDSQKRRTIVTLSNQQYGLAVPDNAFRYNDPRAPVRR
ncbi:MAG: LolA family protein [Novosphingobium sp.]|jgi:outer membrane lipoprotein-sorting protein|uniref:LolA family protein n=1 Tax=Novosphingobium sp. TaxID=1874826 RepID=UPI00391AC3C4